MSSIDSATPATLGPGGEDHHDRVGYNIMITVLCVAGGLIFCYLIYALVARPHMHHHAQNMHYQGNYQGHHYQGQNMHHHRRWRGRDYFDALVFY